MVRMNERKTKHNRQWWGWIRWFIDYRIHSVKTAGHYYMELGMGIFPNMDRSYSRHSIIDSVDYFGKAVVMNDVYNRRYYIGVNSFDFGGSKLSKRKAYRKY